MATTYVILFLPHEEQKERLTTQGQGVYGGSTEKHCLLFALVELCSPSSKSFIKRRSKMQLL